MIGIGVDLVDVERFARMLARRPGLRSRLFTAVEIADSAGQANRLAARFAAKEAVMKALGVGLGSFGFHDVEVVKATSGAPSLHLSGAAAVLAAQRGVRAWHVTLTHTALAAEAVVLAE